jgi:hypothetical protein
MMRSIESGQCAGAGGLGGWLRRHRQLCALACCTAVAVAAVFGLVRGHAQSQQAPAPAATEKTTSAAVPAAAPAAPAATPAIGRQPAPAAGEAPEEARKQEITNECADLLKMAEDLKVEVDKSTKDTLSVSVVRKAGAIELLAHQVRTGTTVVEASHGK